MHLLARDFFITKIMHLIKISKLICNYIVGNVYKYE